MPSLISSHSSREQLQHLCLSCCYFAAALRTTGVFTRLQVLTLHKLFCFSVSVGLKEFLNALCSIVTSSVLEPRDAGNMIILVV